MYTPISAALQTIQKRDKLLSFLLNYDTFISTCTWLAELLLSYIFI